MSDPKAQIDELASHCIQCGFCLEACPTFQITSDESQSPRGRITLAKSVVKGDLNWQEAAGPIDSCLGCVACQTACPSGVEYGAILELARQEILREKPVVAREKLIDVLSDHRLARIQMGLASLLPGGKMPNLLSQLLSGQAPEAETPTPSPNHPWPPLEEKELPPVKGEVYLLEGCVMRVLYPETHEATRRLLRRLGYAVRAVDGGCCGALHAHAGFIGSAEKRAVKLADAFSEDLPIIVNSAGCGSTMKHYGDVFAESARGVAQRTFDASEFFLREGLAELLATSEGLPGMVGTYHDACHLAHGQKIKDAPRALLAAIRGTTWVPLAESDMCCGSAGTYNVFQPALARQLLERKWAHIAATGAQLLASGNPGCHAWIAQAAREKSSAIRVIHTIDLLESSFSGLKPA